MTPILLYGVPAGCSFGAIVALEWSGLPYRLCRIEMPKVVSGEAYRRLNPIGETPTFMSETGEVFSQSLAILLHVARSSTDRRLGPQPGAAGFDRLVEMLSFLHTSFFGAFSPLWQAFEGAQGVEKDMLRAVGQAKVRKAHAQLELLLAGRGWLVGEGQSVADAYFMGIARWNDFHKVLDRRDYPAVHALHERLARDPAVRFAHAVEAGEAASRAGGCRGHLDLAEVLADLRLAA